MDKPQKWLESWMLSGSSCQAWKNESAALCDVLQMQNLAPKLPTTA